MMEWLAWSFAAVSLLGNVGVNLKRRWGMACWMFSNVFFIGYNLHGRSYPQVGLFSAYLVLAVWGFIRWSRGEKKDETAS